MFNLIPKQINQKLMGDLIEEASQVAAAFRIILGAVGITLGIVALSCRNFPVVEAQKLLYALGTGFCVIVLVHFGGQNGIHFFARAPPKLNWPFWTLHSKMASGFYDLAFCFTKKVRKSTFKRWMSKRVKLFLQEKRAKEKLAKKSNLF